MKSTFFSLTLGFLMAHCLLQSTEEAPKKPEDFKTKIELGQGLRLDHLKWSKSGLHKKPNILSELDYKDIRVYMTTLKGTLFNDTYKGEVSLGYGDIYKGRCQDSDYFRNDRTSEFSRSISKISGAYTTDFSAKVGRILPITQGITLTPSFGYAFFLQKFTIHKGYQSLIGSRSFYKNERPIKGLKTSYKARWSAPFIDFLLTIPLLPSLTVDFGYTFYYPVSYTGHGHWNLRRHPGPNFTQKAHSEKSFGQRGELSLRYACTSNFELGFSCAAMSFIARDGHDQWAHYVKSPFRKAHRTATDFMLTASYAF